jgi:predicted ATPase/DNA-binding NarL/FixJ family response regulator
MGERAERRLTGIARGADAGAARTVRDVAGRMRLVERDPIAFSPLPRPLTSLVGREREVAAVTSLLRQREVRLLTLTGPGGVGKTRVAIAVAADAPARFANGAVFVPLATVRDPPLVLPTIAHAFGLQDAGGEQSLGDHLRHVLADKAVLLVLDNVEQVLAAAPAVADLLTSCPEVVVLATSRAPLHISGERMVHIAPLPLPDPLPGKGAAPAAAEALHSDAVRLFVERAQEARSDFALTNVNAEAVVAICRQLEGLPLAIELAAARVRILPPPALRSRLERRLPLLTGGPSDAPHRQRTMRDAIAWSHDLLGEEEQALFRRLSVFVGGFTLEAAAAVASGAGHAHGAEDPGDEDLFLLDGVSALAGASLLAAIDAAGDEPRYVMLETVREFGLEMLAARGEEPAARQRHAEYFHLLAERAHDDALRGSFRSSLADDLANLRAALGWLEQAGEAELSLKLAGALWPIWYVRGPYHEGREWIERALARGGDADAASRGRALLACGLLAIMQGDVARAEGCFAEALPIARGGRFSLAEANALLGLLWVAVQKDELARAAEFGQEALLLTWTTDDPQVAKVTAGMILDNLGSIAFVQGNLGLATTRFTQALAHQREVGHHWGEANSLTGLGYVARKRGDDQAAREAFRAALPLFGAHEDARKIALALAGVSGLAVRHDAARAARLIGAVAALQQAGGMALDPEYRAIYEHDEAAARAALGEKAFAEAWSEGHRLPLDNALALAREVIDAPRTTETPAATRHGLTPRELEVLRLLVEGRTDKEIAAALFISHRTVMNHVASILAKLEVPTRAVAAREAGRQGLI